MRPRLALGAWLLGLAALCALAFAPQLEVQVARNLLLYRTESWWRTLAPVSHDGMGTLKGVVRDARGEPMRDALVIAADARGRTVSTYSDESGSYQLALPHGLYTPLATKAGYADAVPRAGPLPVRVQIAAHETARADFSLRPLGPRARTADSTLQFLDDTTTHSDIPQPVDVRRRAFNLMRAGATLTGSYVYEPLSAGRYPFLLFIYPCWVYPCSTLGWDLLSATMAGQGYVVVSFSPQRGADLEADMDDLLSLIARIKAGELSERGEARKLALSAGSLTSLHLWRVAQLAPTESVQGIVVLGGLSDLFLIRHRFEANELLLEPPFAEPLSTALIGLGQSNLAPEFYARYSPIYHLDALPRAPIALIHGGGDKTVPFEQTPHFAAALAARGIPHEMYLYPKQEHYLDLANINADELDMLEKVLGFLGRALR